MHISVGIVGAGLLGRTLALALSRANYAVTVFEGATSEVKESCAYTGAGMLAPYAELETCELMVFALGQNSVALWSKIINTLPAPVFLQALGTMLVSHARDAQLLSRSTRLLQQKVPAGLESNWLLRLSRIELREYEPSLATRFNEAVFLPNEGQLDNRQLLAALGESIKQSGVICHFQTRVLALEPGQISTEKGKHKFDLIVDCRGLAAKSDIETLRGVRGELIDVFAPEVQISRPVRLMHPRYPIYIVPRENKRYLIGATVVESESLEAITVQSAMELLTAAYSVDTAFAEARIREFRVNCRPALPDNGPRIFHQDGLIRVNGLYRHGFLVTPKLVDLIMQFIRSRDVEPLFHKLLVPEASLLCKF